VIKKPLLSTAKDTRPCVKRKVVFARPRLQVMSDTARIHGRLVEKIWTRRPLVSAMVVLKDADTMVLVRQYRYGINKTLWELPAGTVDEGETPRACAIRECQEETGWIPRKVTSLGSYFNAPAGSEETTFLFVLSSVIKGKMNLDPDEHITVGEFSLARIRRMLKSGEIRDAKSIIGLHRYFSS
jgi:ADP-ribose pyrophosphatase